jgi:two-component system, OmpR family, sensor histidine kinase BaeS
MRIRLVHTQALLLLSAVLMAVLAMGALSAWNLRNGFSEYLATRDVERLEQFALLVSENAERAGGIASLEATGMGLQELFREFGRGQGLPPMKALRDVMLPPEDHGMFSPPPRPIDSIDAFKDRVAVYGLDGQARLGRALPQAAQDTVERPVHIGNEVVAVVRMTKLKPVPNEVEVRFLNTQYQSIIAVACVLLLMALIGAFWISGHWVRPLIAVQAATEKIAQGEFDTRLEVTRSDEIGDAMRNINQMAAGLKKLEGARRQWIAELSHELRTPLTVLRGEIDALIDGIIALTPQAVHSLREEVLQLNALVDDLHLLAMSDLKALPCYFEEVDAARLLEGIVQRFTLRASQLGLTLNLNTELEAPVMVRWDAKRMEQMVGNLLDNSLRYTDAPGQVLVRLRGSDENKVVMEVEDTAPGVSENDLLRIFEPLYRADAARGRSTGGSGLGLAICQQIVKAHHGVIRTEASALGGVLFHLELPRLGDEAK